MALRKTRTSLLFPIALVCAVVFLSSGCIKGPDFPSMLSPRVIVHTPANPASGNIAVTFQLIDTEKEPGNVILEYSTDSAVSFKTATLVDPSESQNLTSEWYPGIIHTVHWDSVGDMVGRSANASVIVKVTPYDATNPSGGTSDVSRTFIVNNIEYNEPPSVNIATPVGVQFGNIPINYFLSDAESDTCSITVEYSTDDGANWQNATRGWAGDGLIGLSSSPSPGTAYMFLWDSRADGVAPSGQIDTVKIRITPSDNFNAGTAGETDSFSVDNTIVNNPPTVTITSAPEEGSTVYTNQVTFAWEGSDTDGTVISYYYSFDHDPPNIQTTDTSATSGVLSLGEHTFRVQALDDNYDFSAIVSRTFTISRGWTQKTPSNQPSARTAHAMAYDAVRGVTVLFGGAYWSAGWRHLNDTWEWDGTNWTEKQPTASPFARRWHGMAYDSARGVTILFGGYGDAYPEDDTWEWDGTDWRQQFPTDSPFARGGHRMAHDSARGVVVLFGGDDAAASVYSDTWEWDGTNWTEKHPATGPCARRFHAMVYDSARGLVTLFGGYDSSSRDLNDTWEWNGTNWIQNFPTAIPSVRHAHQMAYDSACGAVVLFGGGLYPSPSYNDTWEWDGTNWTGKSPTVSPPVRCCHEMAYDSARQVVVLFGGQYYDGAWHCYDDTWEY